MIWKEMARFMHKEANEHEVSRLSDYGLKTTRKYDVVTHRRNKLVTHFRKRIGFGCLVFNQGIRL